MRLCNSLQIFILSHVSQVGQWFIVTSLSDASNTRRLDRHQVTPFTITATKANTITTVRPLPLLRSDTCSPDARRNNSFTQNIKTEEWQYWNVQGNNPSGFAIYVDNVTFGTLTIYAGTDTLPSGRCNASSVFCAETPVGKITHLILYFLVQF